MKKDKNILFTVNLLSIKDLQSVRSMDASSGFQVEQWLEDNSEYAWGIFKNGTDELIGYCTIGYTKEVKDTSADYFDEISESLKQLWEIDIPVKINDWEEKQLEWEKIAQKYNCDFLGYDIIHKRVEVGIGWENGFPEFDVLNQLIEEIEKQMKIKQEKAKNGYYI